jgi:hypothetical protein
MLLGSRGVGVAVVRVPHREATVLESIGEGTR